MYAPKTFILTSLLALFSTTSAVPAPAVNETEASTVSRGCFLPDILFITIKSPFTLSALTDEPINPWPVQLPPPSATEVAQPYISWTRIAQPIFRLTNGRLTTGGDDHEQYPARFGPTILSFPPVLQPLYFGGPSSAAVEFSARYACDAEGNQYLELTTTQPLVVPELSEGQEVYGKPEASEEKAVAIHLKITTTE